MKQKNTKTTPPSFLWDVIGHNHRKKEYTLKNKATGQIRTVPKELFQDLSNEQKRKNDGNG